MKYLKGVLSLILITTVYVSYGQDTKKFKARNGVDFEYEIVFPKNYSKNKSYELAVVFTEIESKTKGYQPTVSDLKESTSLENTIYFVPKVPIGRPHWISHPVHHGLNDFMANMRKLYGKSNQKFHFIGHLYGGRVAQTYSGMSSEYVASLSLAHSQHWKITKQEYFDEIFGKGFNIYVYDSKSAENLSINVSKAKFLQTNDFDAALTIIDKNVKSL